MVLQIPIITNRLSYYRLISLYAHRYLPIPSTPAVDYISLASFEALYPHPNIMEFIHNSNNVHAIAFPDGTVMVHPEGAFKAIAKRHKAVLSKIKKSLRRVVSKDIHKANSYSVF